MAYDANDPADKKIMADAIKAAVDAAIAEATSEHEADVAGLKNKNKQLLDQIKKGGEGDPAEITRLETEVETLKVKARDGEKTIKALTKERDETKTALDGETNFNRNLLVDNGLTEALVANKVAPQFLPAVKAMLAGQVTVKTDGDKRLAVVGDKALGDFVKEWSLGDDGKHYVAAPGNGGGGAPGGQGQQGSAKTMTRAAYNEMNTTNPQGAAAFFREGGSLTD